MSKRVYILGAIILCVCIVVTAFAALERYTAGIVNVRISCHNQTDVLEIMCSRASQYSVRMLDKDEQILKGGEETPIDGSELGKYRIVVKISDTSVASTLREKYPSGETHILQDIPDISTGIYRIRVSSAGCDHIYCIYIGSDKPFSLNPLSQEYPLGYIPEGKIVVPFSICE